MRNQRRSKQPWTREQLRERLRHLIEQNVVRQFFEPRATGGRWVVAFVDGTDHEWTEAQVYAACVAAVASERVWRGSGWHDHADVADCFDAVSEPLGQSAVAFSCAEADWMAKAMRAVGRDGLADAFMDEHAAGDEPGDAHYRGRHVLEATEVFTHPAIAQQVPPIDGWPGEIVGAP